AAAAATAQPPGARAGRWSAWSGLRARPWAPPYRRYVPPGRTTLLAGFWVVKAQNRPCHQPAAASHGRGSLSSKPLPERRGGGQPLVILTGGERPGGHNRYRPSAGGVPRVRGWCWGRERS